MHLNFGDLHVLFHLVLLTGLLSFLDLNFPIRLQYRGNARRDIDLRNPKTCASKSCNESE